MGGLRFSLLQLLICIGLILFIAYTIINFKPTTPKAVAPEIPAVTIPFQEIKLK